MRSVCLFIGVFLLINLFGCDSEKLSLNDLIVGKWESDDSKAGLDFYKDGEGAMFSPRDLNEKLWFTYFITMDNKLIIFKDKKFKDVTGNIFMAYKIDTIDEKELNLTVLQVIYKNKGAPFIIQEEDKERGSMVHVKLHRK